MINIKEIASKIFSGSASTLVDSVKGVIDESKYSAEEKAEMDLKLREVSIAHEEKLIDNATKQLELTLKDVDSARQMQIAALGQDDKFSKRFIYFIAGFVMLSATGFGIGLTFVEIPEGNKRLVEMFADIYLFAGALTVLQFFFGNSYRSFKGQNNG